MLYIRSQNSDSHKATYIDCSFQLEQPPATAFQYSVQIEVKKGYDFSKGIIMMFPERNNIP
jgi:hypothetical protein